MLPLKQLGQPNGLNWEILEKAVVLYVACTLEVA